MAQTGFAKKLSDIASAASQKSGAIVEAARLNTEINRILEEIDELFYALGQAYYEENKERHAGPHIDILEKINLLEHEIHIRNSKLLKQKGLLYCSGCDSVVSCDDEFCSKCGEPVPRDQKQGAQKEYCRNCGEPVHESLQYCSKCGILLK